MIKLIIIINLSKKWNYYKWINQIKINCFYQKYDNIQLNSLIILDLNLNFQYMTDYIN